MRNIWQTLSFSLCVGGLSINVIYAYIPADSEPQAPIPDPWMPTKRFMCSKSEWDELLTAAVAAALILGLNYSHQK